VYNYGNEEIFIVFWFCFYFNFSWSAERECGMFGTAARLVSVGSGNG
jgi:hypothetical protein